MVPSMDVLQVCEAAKKGLSVLKAQCKNARLLNVNCVGLVVEILWFPHLEPHLLHCNPLVITSTSYPRWLPSAT